MSEVIITGLSLLFVYLASMVAIVQFKGDTSIANFTWGGGVMLVALYTFFRMSSFLPQQMLLTSFIVIWALRLIFYVYIRYAGKDPRFATWKWQGLKALYINCIWVFGQTVLIALMSYPVILVNSYNAHRGLTTFDLLGLVVWIFGFFFESISDYQLFNFMHNAVNKGRVMRYGLWRYSRHPNYFGETMMWWGVFCIASTVPYGWIAVIAPFTITFLLVFVTGIPWIEKAMANNPEYQEYTKKTTIFIPWFTKKYF